MQAVVLAAGMGRRLGALTLSSTKCMVKLNGKPLVSHLMDNLLGSGIERFVFVLGHGAAELRAHLARAYPHCRIEYVTNPIYADTNNIYSLYLARQHLAADDSLVLESDLVLDRAILAATISSPHPNVAAVAKYEAWMDGTVVCLDKDNVIRSFVAKEAFAWEQAHSYFKTMNVYKLSAAFSRDKFVPLLEGYIQARGRHQYYEEVLGLVAFIGQADLVALDLGHERWYEIDTLQDLDVASTLFADGKERAAKLAKRYGGYWRFPALVDHCYLVNPYFPDARCLAELKHNCVSLMTQYPSGQSVHNQAVAAIYDCDEAGVVLGNGASELLRHAVSSLDGPLGMPVPSFEEYRHSRTAGDFVAMTPSHEDFTYGVEEIVTFCRAHHLKTFVLVNPDNPTGHFLAKSEVIALTHQLAALGVTLVLDESFVDFVDGTTDHELLGDGQFEEFSNLVVIKSLSKSYGVPGLRLGVLASAHHALVARIRKLVPIWNINSLGEYFLQIIPKYQVAYRTACKRLAAERAWLLHALAEIPLLKPLPSGANYVFCKIAGGGWNGPRLTQELCDQHWILIRDCTQKPGVNGQPYVRIAVRDRKDNERLVASLQRMLV